MSYPLFHYAPWKDGEKVELLSGNDVFNRIPDCENVDEDGFGVDDLATIALDCLKGNVDGVRTEIVKGEQGVKLVVPKGSICKYLRGMLGKARSILCDREIENELILDLAGETRLSWELGDIFHESYMHTLWLDDSWSYAPNDTIRFLGRFVTDNQDSDVAIRLVDLYYHK